MGASLCVQGCRVSKALCSSGSARQRDEDTGDTVVPCRMTFVGSVMRDV